MGKSDWTSPRPALSVCHVVAVALWAVAYRCAGRCAQRCAPTWHKEQQQCGKSAMLCPLQTADTGSTSLPTGASRSLVWYVLVAWA